MVSFRCYDNSDVIATLIITIFIFIKYNCGGNYSKSLFMAMYGDVWRCPNLGGIDHEKLYRATLNLSRGGILCRHKQQS